MTPDSNSTSGIHALVGALLALFLAIITSVAILPVDAFVILHLWRWFVGPIYAQVPDVTFGQAAGLAVVLGFFRQCFPTGRTVTSFITMAFTSLFALALGFAVHISFR